ncbi:hypothetical protein CLCR_07928 [Cladophialophora carrionii]|uniref:Uncharacterized protein n=1 Tax=Cladophialophora carrionii TaxID=86049 RepID=A0A1C1CUM8_9EURO|nr:hypothetical protein CLCR_07928 [Cladophialophora carrionii]
MPFLDRVWSPFLCCFPVQPREEHPTSDLQTLPSALHLPASQVPHAAGQCRSNQADTDALHELFRTSSSIRGYRTASIPSGSHVQREPSFDADFKFGLQDHPRKQPSRLEQLGNHIKQKLSESGLSKSGSGSHIASEDNAHNPIEQDNTKLRISNPEISLSQRSTGLLDLLQSRTASEGGYDSDAKSIQTAMLKSREGTMKLSPTRAQTLLSPMAALRHIATDGASASPEARESDDDDLRPQPDLRVLSSHSSTTACTKDLSEVEQESPSTDLGQLNTRASVGAIELLPSSVSATMSGSPAVLAKEADPFTTAPSSNEFSLPAQHDTHFAEMLRSQGDKISAANRESLITNGTNPRASLMSSLDPNLLEFISRSGESLAADAAGCPSKDHGADAMVDPTSAVLDKSATVRPATPARENTSRRDVTSLTESERSSVHLYSMRISQRLASPSFVATQSRPNTSYTTSQVARQDSTERRPSLGRTSTSANIVGRITAEHNRRPSDLQTRRLFEGDRTCSRHSSKRKNGSLPESLIASRNPAPLRGTDDGSSSYWSDGEVEQNGLQRTRTTKRNPNSIAIGGRSESISLPIGSSVGSLSVAEESAWFKRKSSQHKRGSEPDSPLQASAKRNRSVSLPDGPTHQPRTWLAHPSHRVQHPTEANETMSVIDAYQLQDARKYNTTESNLHAGGDTGTERLTDISAQTIRDAHDEDMSEIGPLDPSHGGEARPELTSFWSDAGPSMLGTGLLVPGKRSKSEDQEPLESSLNGRPNLPESATNLWQRTFKRVLEESENDPLGGFLTAPRFDRDGRRKSTRSSISTVQLPNEHRVSEADVDPLETRVKNNSQHPMEKSLLEVCMRKPDPLPSVNPRRSIVIMEGRKGVYNTVGPSKTSRKKSLLDIGRRFSVIGSCSEAERTSGASTPLKDLLGLWGRFPSHTRDDRCGSAGAKDGVAVRDFGLECQDENSRSCSAGHLKLNPMFDVPTPESRKMLSFSRGRIGKGQTRSAGSLRAMQTSRVPGVRLQKSKKGLAARWKRLYRTSSMEFQAYTHNYGHRSSIGVGASVEYPELEVVPGSVGWRSDLDGTVETDDGHQRERAGCVQDGLQQPLDTAPWTQAYRDCVGSLSALKSDPHLRRASVDDGPGPAQYGHVALGAMQSAELRDSTVDFESQLGKEKEAAKEGLMRKVESMQPLRA